MHKPRYSPWWLRKSFYLGWIRGEKKRSWTSTLEDNEKKQITKGNDNRYQGPEWTPDGKYMLLPGRECDGSHKIGYIMSWEALALAMSRSQMHCGLLEGAFSTDDQYVWFSGKNGSWTYNAQCHNYQIFNLLKSRWRVKWFPQTSDRFGISFLHHLVTAKWLVYATRHENWGQD